MLVTGGGAFNSYLVERIQYRLNEFETTVVVPDVQTVNFKEAIAMALIGTLRWRDEANVLHSVTGASQDSVGGAVWGV
jgi:anhydro-N-acetylmuramic acid kinase